MLMKKLLTLACAVGILACGACFMPDLVQVAHKPQPPPLRIDLTGIRTMDVAVTDASQLKKLDTDRLADHLEIVINGLSRGTKVRVRQSKDPRPADATLHLTVQEESATLTPLTDGSGMEIWTFTIRVAASLTSGTGQEIWHQSGQGHSYSERMSKQDASRIWESDAVRNDVFYQLSSRFVHSMFYGDPHDH